MNFFNKFNKLKTSNPFKSNITKIMVISVFALLLITGGTSYAYLTYSKSGTLINTVSSGNLSLTLNETSILSLNKAVPQLDDNALTNNPGYTFTLTNSGDVLTHYEIYLNSVCSTSQTYTIDNSTITPDICMPEKYVKVGVSVNNGDYTILNFENKRVTIDAGEIFSGERKTYTVKLWLDVDTPNEYNSYYDEAERNILFASQINIIGEQRDAYETTVDYCFTTSDNTITNYECYENNTKGYPTIVNVVIPEKINEQTITAIGDTAFMSSNLESVTMPDTITTIGSYAFYGNSLTSVTIPNSVTTIGEYAFENNSLVSITLGSSLTTIETYAFSSNNLASITIPNSVTTIGNYAFFDNKLTSVTLGNSVTAIGEYAFSNNNLTSITIPNSVTTIGSYAFTFNPLEYVLINQGSNLQDLDDGTPAIGRAAFLHLDPETGEIKSVIVYNNSGKSFDWGFIFADMQSGETETGEIYDSSGVLLATITTGTPS